MVEEHNCQEVSLYHFKVSQLVEIVRVVYCNLESSLSILVSHKPYGLLCCKRKQI